jgi:hypothetical protein
VVNNHVAVLEVGLTLYRITANKPTEL